VVTSTIAFEGDGRWREYEGGVQDWLLQSQRARSLAASAASAKPARQEPAATAAPAPAPSAAPSGPRRKLGYKEQRELEALPARLQALEQEQAAIQAELADGTLYAKDGARAAQLAARNAALDDELLEALERLQALGGL
jgi:ATP-binding cassette subfamily F protein uup